MTSNTSTLLLVEDSPALRLMLEVFLRKEGYCVLSSGSAEEALEPDFFNLFTAHILITDVNLPGMNGIDLAGRLKLPTVFMSGRSGSEELAAARYPDAPFLVKPFPLAALRRAVERLEEVRPAGIEPATSGLGIPRSSD